MTIIIVLSDLNTRNVIKGEVHSFIIHIATHDKTVLYKTVLYKTPSEKKDWSHCLSTKQLFNHGNIVITTLLNVIIAINKFHFICKLHAVGILIILSVKFVP